MIGVRIMPRSTSVASPTDEHFGRQAAGGPHIGEQAVVDDIDDARIRQLLRELRLQRLDGHWSGVHYGDHAHK
jgi:hypothetical protein